MNPKPHKAPDVILAERLHLLTMCIRTAVSQGEWNDLPTLFREREQLLAHVEQIELGAEAMACLERIHDESHLIFAEIRRERASVLADLRAFDASAKTRMTYRPGNSHHGACDELT